MYNILLGLVGLAGGLLVSAGMYALITTLGIINRFAQDTHTANETIIYEECVIWGATVGNVIWVMGIGLAESSVFLAIGGVVAGIYAGCLAVALAEMIKTIPIFIERTKITSGFGWIFLMIALGKGIGGIIYFFLLNYRNGG